MSELLDRMGDHVGLIRLMIENFDNDLISKQDLVVGVNNSLDELHALQKAIAIKTGSV